MSDIGTKALGVHRTQLLLHQLNVASSSDFCVVGMPEYESQCPRHGGEKKMNQLVKQVTRILMLLGLESGGVTAASVLVLEDDAFTSAETCVVEPNVQGGFSFATAMFFFMVLLVILGAWYRLYRKAQDALDSYDHCYTQMAVLDSAFNRVQDMYEGLREQHFTDINILDNLVDRHVQEIGALQTQLEVTNDALRRLREGHNELQGKAEMLCDSCEQVHMDWFKLVVLPRSMT